MNKPTRYEKIQKMNLEELGHYLCEQHDECDRCPVTDLCRKGQNGFITWLKEEDHE